MAKLERKNGHVPRSVVTAKYDAHHIVLEFRKAAGGDQADVSRTDDGDLHPDFRTLTRNDQTATAGE